MILNLGSAIFNAETASGGGTPAWGTEMGQGEGYKFSFENYETLIASLVYNSIPNPQTRVKCPLGKGGNASNDYEFVICGHYTNVFVNGVRISNTSFDLLVVKKLVGDNHIGRRTLKYNPRITLDGTSNNSRCYELMAKTLGVSNQGSWFISEINTLNQDELHFTAHVLDKDKHFVFKDSDERSQILSSFLNKDIFKEIAHAAILKAAERKDEPLQVIYYGAPGTGKSHQTDKLVEGDKQNKIHQRTTFHPDSDYSSFVGCYKPSKENGELTYKFVPQAFLKAYVAAWKNPEQPYYLIIEEINRGNCAQIFGDIFQLLDRREDGFSKYHITSDTDIEAYLRDEAFADVLPDELPAIEGINTEQILSGEIMQLPSNLHIYATMNTSDQSLFPIDSAFKRRWEWEYKPIEQPQDAQFRDWKIVTDDGGVYDWWNFLTKVNNRIFSTTQSEDKKMGYWFTRADAQKRISQKKFIGKVLFYLWNDVFKDYARTESTIFKVFKDAEKKEAEEYTFTDFFLSEGVTDRIHRLMSNLEIEREEWAEPIDERDDDEPTDNTGDKYTKWKNKHQAYWNQLKPLLEASNIPQAENVSYYAAYYMLPVFGNPNITLAFFHYTHKGRNKVCVGIRWEKNEDVAVWDKIVQLKDAASESIGLPIDTWDEQKANTLVVKLEGLNFKDADSTEKSLHWLADQGEALYNFFMPRLAQNDEAAD